MTSSTLLVDDFFQAEDDRFLDELVKTASSRYLAALADRWAQDPRPWARSMILAYLERPLAHPGHHPLVKRLFRHAEAAQDDVLMGAFLVAFDRLLHRVRRVRRLHDWQSRTWSEEERLVSPRNVLLADPPEVYRGKKKSSRWRLPKNPRLFTMHTRRWLQRRAWRYFRHMGHRDPGRYRRAMVATLPRYHDEDLLRGENILDSRSLMEVLFRRSPALEFRAATVELKGGHRLADLVAAPRFPSAWSEETAASDLISLLLVAPAKLVRVVVLQLLRSIHRAALRRLEPARLIELLDHPEGEVSEFGAELVADSEELAKAPVSLWLRLLETRSLTALQILCDALSRHVRSDRFDVDQLLDLAQALPAPVAQLGLRLLTERFPEGWDDAARLIRLAGVRSQAVARESTRWALAQLGKPCLYQADQVVRFFDSAVHATRQGAWDWLVPGSAGWDDPDLWNRLLENPYDDVRLKLVDVLERRAAALPADAENLERLWTTVLLGIHRGSRRKPRALASIVELVDREPQRAERLIPVLAAVARSIRAPERRQGVATLVRLIERRPELAGAVGALVPELVMEVTGGSRCG